MTHLILSIFIPFCVFWFVKLSICLLITLLCHSLTISLSLSVSAKKASSSSNVPLLPSGACNSKRKASTTSVVENKRVKVPDTCNPTVNESVYVALDVLHGKFMVSECDYEVVNRPNFLGDKRINRVKVYPESDADYKWLSPNSIATSSFHRGVCSGCLMDDNSVCSMPVKNVPKVIIMGN